MSADTFGYQDWSGRVPLTSNELRPGVLRNILEHAGQPSTNKNYQAPSVNNAEAEKPRVQVKLTTIAL